MSPWEWLHPKDFECSRTRPAVQAVQVWSEEPTSLLQDYSENTDWNMFRQRTDLEKDASSVLPNMDFCIKTVLTVLPKPSRCFQIKNWLDNNLWSVLKVWDAVFRSGVEVCRTGHRELMKGIRDAKHMYNQHIEGYFQNNKPCSLWRGIKASTDYKGSTIQISNSIALPDTLNQFFSRFEDRDSRDGAHTTPLKEEQIPILQHHQVRASLMKIDTRTRQDTGVPQDCRFSPALFTPQTI